MKTSSFYPPKRYTISDLMDPDYQSNVNTDMFNMMKKKEHRVMNRYFQNLLLTQMNKHALRHLPSMDSKVMLDRILPECILESKDNFMYRVRSVLSKLMPVSDQMLELKSEMKDAFKITTHQELLMELVRKISRIQTSIMKLMKKLREGPTQARGVITATMYTVLKASEAVFAFRETVERAVNLHLVMKPAVFYRMIEFIDKQQLAVYKMCMVVISPNPVFESAPGATTTSQDVPAMNPMGMNAMGMNPMGMNAMGMKPMGTSRIYRYNYDQTPPVTVDENVQTPPSTNISALIGWLKALAAEQAQAMHHVWHCVINDMPIKQDIIHWLIKNTAENVTQINQQIKVKNFENTELMQLIYQTTVQHQILVDMVVLARFGNNTVMHHDDLNNFQRYAFKVQTKELLERGLILHHQQKMDAICGQGLTGVEKQLMEKLKLMDRELVALQQNRIRIPSHVTPWTADVDNIYNAAYLTMNPVLNQCLSALEMLLKMPTIPHPCLTAKLVETVTTLQQKIAIFKRTLPAQWFSDKVRSHVFRRCSKPVN